jgi:hypothetical protein
MSTKLIPPAPSLPRPQIAKFYKSLKSVKWLFCWESDWFNKERLIY